MVEIHELMTLKEAAAHCRCSEGTIRRWMRDGRFPPPLRRGRKLLWPAAAVRAWMNGAVEGAANAAQRPPDAPLATPPAVASIDPTAVYFVDQARQVLRLRASTIRREVREGRLRIAKRAGRYYLLGEWILEWLRAGELPQRKPPTASAN